MKHSLLYRQLFKIGEILCEGCCSNFTTVQTLIVLQVPLECVVGKLEHIEEVIDANIEEEVIPNKDIINKIASAVEELREQIQELHACAQMLSLLPQKGSLSIVEIAEPLSVLSSSFQTSNEAIVKKKKILLFNRRMNYLNFSSFRTIDFRVTKQGEFETPEMIGAVSTLKLIISTITSETICKAKILGDLKSPLTTFAEILTLLKTI
ncbi:hypothetical protein JTB14_024373 [Gonioctena quinquepunctata]|nr:hypothetical protein JTB14_024373 [Gonioctena quinquepunctata]